MSTPVQLKGLDCATCLREYARWEAEHREEIDAISFADERGGRILTVGRDHPLVAAWPKVEKASTIASVGERYPEAVCYRHLTEEA